MAHNQQGTPLGPGAVIVSRMIDSVVKMLPSEQEKRGDQKLEKAREIAEENKPVIFQDDLDAIAGKISHARDVRDGLDSKSGLSKFFHAREYLKVAREAYRFTKHVSDRRRDAAFFSPPLDTSSTTANCPSNLNKVTRIAQRLYRCHLSCNDAFPSPCMKDKWLKVAWSNACERACGYSHTPPPVEELVVETIELLVDMKAEITNLVQSQYGFGTQQSSEMHNNNTTLAHTLLTNMAFIYREPNFGGTPRHSYQHPIIQEAINIIWFPNRDGDGVIFCEHFTPIPIKLIALALTLIECCINEWTSGIYKVSNWKEGDYKAVYDSHSKLLSDLHGGVALAQLRLDLLKNARIHVGTLFELLTGPGEPRAGVLGIAVEEDPPVYTDPDISKLNPMIEISLEH